MNIFTVDGVDYDFTGYASIPVQTFVGGNNLLGDFVGSLVKDGENGVILTWDFITQDNMSAYLKQWSPAFGGLTEQSVTFYSAYEDAVVTRTMQLKEQTSASVMAIDNNGVYGLNGFSMTFAEVTE